VLIFIAAILVATELQAQADWKHVINQPVLVHGVAGQWDNGAVLWPSVIKDGDTLRMWYAGSDALLGLGAVKIGYAWSLNGINWYRSSKNPVFAADLFWEAGNVVCPAVIKDGNIFKMWYGAAGVPPRLVGYATSTDGVNWRKHSEPVLQLGTFDDWDESIIGPGTVKKENTVYKMWYWGGQQIWPFSVIQIGVAISNDGISWVKHDDVATTAAPFSRSDPVLKIGGAGAWDQYRVWSPAVLATATGYEMWYAGRAGYTTPPQFVGYAISTDGMFWEKSADNPVISVRPAWGFSYLTSAVLEFDGFYHLWFTSFPLGDEGQSAEIGYARSVSDSAAIAKTPRRYFLAQNHPNPFNRTTVLQYGLSKTAEVVLEIYDILGRRVKTLFRRVEEAGFKSAAWDGADEFGRPVASGIYLYRLQAGGNFIQTRKMVLLER
jgi:hypothetical protein